MSEKPCRTCGVTKSLTEFYAYAKGGHVLDCKPCYCARKKAHRRTPRGRAVHRRERARYFQSERGKAVKRAYRARHAAKYRARYKLNNAIARGRIQRQPCGRCGTTAQVEGHHHDYSEPLEVHWLCKSCHLREHYGETVHSDVTHRP